MRRLTFGRAEESSRHRAAPFLGHKAMAPYPNICWNATCVLFSSQSYRLHKANQQEYPDCQEVYFTKSAILAFFRPLSHPIH